MKIAKKKKNIFAHKMQFWRLIGNIIKRGIYFLHVKHSEYTYFAQRQCEQK